MADTLSPAHHSSVWGMTGVRAGGGAPGVCEIVIALGDFAGECRIAAAAFEIVSRDPNFVQD
ncbi:MAG TPA: hypothetical protein VFN87_20070 [Solirubrobacteraceae bacterium]|nr:hypothetical protein [Solirubrobacteraceae bacterium]